ncbi:MAG: P-loop NTPase, partial [Thermoplasmata archaeon]
MRSRSLITAFSSVTYLCISVPLGASTTPYPVFLSFTLLGKFLIFFLKKYKTGILDLDLHGPSIPFILGINNIKIIESENGIFPVEWNNIKVMSLDIFMQGRAAP